MAVSSSKVCLNSGRSARYCARHWRASGAAAGGGPHTVGERGVEGEGGGGVVL